MTPQIEEYVNSHISREPDYLYRIDRLTNLRMINGRMCSGHIQGRLLKMLTTMAAPKRVLELGTFSGYSALCIAEGLQPGATIDTIEVDDELEDFILQNISMSPDADKVRLHIGDALEVMKQWDDNEFDLIFIDADKRRYIDYFNRAIRLLRKGGLHNSRQHPLGRTRRGDLPTFLTDAGDNRFQRPRGKRSEGGDRNHTSSRRAHHTAENCRLKPFLPAILQPA